MPERLEALMPGVNARAQMPFANFTVGQVFFAVVHDQLRPPLDAFHKAMAEREDERPALEPYLSLLQRCWSTAVAERPKFKQARRDESRPQPVPHAVACPPGLPRVCTHSGMPQPRGCMSLMLLHARALP